MRWDSPLVLAAAGTLALHLLAITAGDALIVTHPPRPWVPAPHVELVDIEVPPEIKPPPPLPPPPPEPQAAPAPEEPKPVARHVAPAPSQVRTTPAPTTPPEPTETPTSGGDDVVHMDDIAPSASGVAVATGPRTTGHVGRGGKGGGTGAGSGSGTTDEPPRPVSVASVKTKPRAKGDYSHINLGRDYPPEAKALHVEGAIHVLLIIDDHGKVTSRTLLDHLGHGLDELALQRAAQLEFEPAKDFDDQPVPFQITWTFDMVPPE